MTPEKADAVLRAVLASIRLFAEEAELIEARHPQSAAHLLASLRQCEKSLQQLMGRDEAP